MPNNFVSYANAISLMTGVNNKKVGKSDLTDIFATGTTNNTGSEISSGTYFYLNSELVKAIDDIAINAQFVEDTNYEVVSGVLNEETSTDGGHFIQDASGNVLHQEPNLQFAGYLKTTDDSNGKKTVVSDAPTEITYNAYNALTPAQKQGTKWLITNAPDGGGSSHTIKDGDGTTMPTQPNLQFADAKVTNDAQGQATKVQNFVDIDWDDWQEVDDNDNTYYRVTDAPLVDGNVEVDLMKKLWENPAPTASFSAQTITLNSADYDFLMCVYSVATGYLIVQIRDVIVQKGDNFVLQAVSATTSNNVQIASRVCQRASDTSYSALDAYFQTQGSARATNNAYCIPIAIYGIKQKVSISLSAIISNVSTSASKCMLSDGETSVEDTLNYSTEEHVVGKWIDGSTLYEKTIDCGALPNATTKTIAHNIVNLDKYVEIKAFGYYAAGKQYIPIPFSEVSSTNIHNQMGFYTDANNIYISTGSNRSAWNGYVTIRYTKTS